MRAAAAAGAPAGALAGATAGALVLAVIAGGTGAAPSSAETRPPARPAGLAAHLPFDGSVREVLRLGAFRAEPVAEPRYAPGVLGAGILPAAGQARAARLHVTNLSRLLLLGRTPATGTIMLWAGATTSTATSGAPPDTAAAGNEGTAPPDPPLRPDTLLVSDGPLALSLAISPRSHRLAAAFLDDAGTRWRIAAALPPAAATPPGSPAAPSWWHIALGWDAPRGIRRVYVQGELVAEQRGAPFRMPHLPRAFEIGSAAALIDDFRLYRRLLEPVELRALPGLASASASPERDRTRDAGR